MSYGGGGQGVGRNMRITNAQLYDNATRYFHHAPSVMDLAIFRAFRVDWFAVEYNEQGFLQVSEIFFLDGSSYRKGGQVDNTDVWG